VPPYACRLEDVAKLDTALRHAYEADKEALAAEIGALHLTNPSISS